MRRVRGLRWMVPVVFVMGASIAGCGSAAQHVRAAAPTLRRYIDPAGWTLRYPSTMYVEHSTSGPGLATFTEITVASFAQQRAVHSGRTRDGGYVTVRPPLDPQGRFPRDGTAFRMFVIDGGPPGNLTVADSRFPVLLSTFTLPRRDAFPLRDYTELGVPDERTRSIDADSEHYQALAFVGPRASPQARSALRRIIASLAFRRPQVGTTVGEQTVLGSANEYPVGSFTLIHARAEICNGSVRSCRAGRAPFYLVHAPGVLHQPDLIDPCTPTAAACSPPGAFYAIGWRSEDILGGYRSGCDLRLDRRREQFYCTNSAARWDRVGRVIRRPAGARFGDPLQFAFAKIAWDGDVVMIAGMDGNPPRDPARRLLWATRPGSGAVPVTRGEDLPHAYMKVHAAGLLVTFTLPFSLDWSYECVPLVVGSVPKAGADVRRGSAVSLHTRVPGCGAASPAVPVGRLPSYRVPDFIGKPLTAAIAWIQHRNLYWAATIPPLHAGDAASLFANYTINRQRPRPGGAIKLGNEGHDSFQPTPLSLTVNGRPPAGR